MLHASSRQSYMRQAGGSVERRVFNSVHLIDLYAAACINMDGIDAVGSPG